METLLAQPALRFGEEHHDVADLILVGLMTGRWQALERAVERGLALEAESIDRASLGEIDAELANFRYERRLIAAADLERWLAERDMSLSDLEGVLRRRLLCQQLDSATARPVAKALVQGVIRVEAICGGTLLGCAAELRAWHAGSAAAAAMRLPAANRPEHDTQNGGVVGDVIAVALADPVAGMSSMGVTELWRRIVRLRNLRDEHQRFATIAVGVHAIEARLFERRLDWTLVIGNELGFEREGAARETRLNVVHDGVGLRQVAEMLGLKTTHRELEIGRAPAELASQLLPARPGDLVGPWSENDQWRVLEVVKRLEPESNERDQLRQRARDELLNELLERYAAGRAEVSSGL